MFKRSRVENDICLELTKIDRIDQELSLAKGKRHTMNERGKPKTGDTYWSKRTGNKITITAVDDDKIYYEIEGFKTIAPLFLTVDKFRHLVGIDDNLH